MPRPLLVPCVAASWEEVIPSSFKMTLYLPSLKISITAGSFILYERQRLDGESGAHTKSVGRIIKVVDSIEGIDNPECLAGLQASQQPTPDNVLVQYLKVNVFSDQSMISGKHYSRQLETSQTSSTSADGNDETSNCWQRVAQLCQYDWISSSAVAGLAFVLPDAVSNSMMGSQHAYDDCRGMFNVFLLKHQMDSTGHVSCIPTDSCPPFPCLLQGFSEQWSVDHCQIIFNSILQIRRDMHRSLCRIAQSQGDFAIKKTKLQVPSCSWFHIKSIAAFKGVDSVTPVRYTQPKAVLSWGLTLSSCPYVGSLDIIRFDTNEKMKIFRQLFGVMSGVGIRKRRPNYCDGRSVLSMNDVLNIIICRNVEADVANEAAQDGESHDNEFKCFGTADDGIDHEYDSLLGVLQIVLRYRKMVVTHSSLNNLSSVGVIAHQARRTARDNALADQDFEIAPGMEFVDGIYVMQVRRVYANEIHAQRAYKIIVDATKRTMRSLQSTEIVVYTDVAHVQRQIEKMLD